MLVAAATLQVVQLSSPSHPAGLWSHVAGGLAAVVTAWLFSRRARAVRGREAAGWWTGAVVAVFMVADGVDALSRQAFSREPSVVSGIYVFGVVLAASAQVHLLARPAFGRLGRITQILDATSVATALFGLAWHFVLSPARPTLGPEATMVFTMATLLMILGAAWAFIQVFSTTPEHNGYALHLLGCALAVGAIGSLTALHGYVTDRPGLVLSADGLLLLVFLLMALAGTQNASAAPHVTRQVLSARSVLLPYLPVAFSLVTFVVLYLWRGTPESVLLGALLGAMASAMLRQLVSLFVIKGLVAELDNQRDRLDRLAHRDALTGLLNRPGLAAGAGAAFSRVHSDGLTAVLVMDLDDFKPVNDTFGHGAGDAVLVGVGERLTEITRPTDVVARLGGDEFVVLLPELGDPAVAETIASRIVDRLAEPMAINGQTVWIGVSIGVVVSGDPSAELEDLLRRADAALYEAKAAGRNTFRRAPDVVPVPPETILSASGYRP